MAYLFDMPRALMYHSSSVHGDYIYVAGGLEADGFVSDGLYSYDTSAKVWLTKARMNQKRHVLFRNS